MRLTLTAILLLAALGAHGQPMAPIDTPAQGPSRHALREQLLALQQSGDDSADAADGGRAYREVLEALGYHDLLAEHLAERLERNLEGCAQEPAAWRALGEARMRSGNQGRRKAFDAFQKALALNEADGETLALLAELLHREGLYAEADAQYEKALRAEPDNVRANLGRAALQVRNGEILAASKRIDAQGAAAQPHDVHIRIMLRKALSDFERRGGWFDDVAENHAAYGRLLYRAGRIMDAMLASRRAVELEPGDYEAWNFLAAMQLQLGNLEQGRQAYEKSLEANPDQPQVERTRQQLMQQLTPGQ